MRFLTTDLLIERLVGAIDGPRPVVFLLGSGATMPRDGQPGVPSSNAVIKMIGDTLGREFPPDTTYQDAFEQLIALRGQDAANHLIQRAVLMALRENPANIGPGAADSDFEKLEGEVGNWQIPPGLAALAALAAHHPKSFGGTFLTTNFDPLIEIAMARAELSWHSTALHADGSLLYLRGSGTGVVHLHGSWWNSDTLHTSTQLRTTRRQLKASLSKMLGNSILVVLGYGGWKDIVMSTLQDVLLENDRQIDVLWAFYSDDEERIQNQSAHVFDVLSESSARGRTHFYKNVDIDEFARGLFSRVVKRAPAESLPIFLKRALVARSEPSIYSGLVAPWGDDAPSMGDFIKLLELLSPDLPATAAVILVKLLLPSLERQEVHQANNPRQFAWVRESLRMAANMLSNRDEIPDDPYVSGSAIDALTAAQKPDTTSHDQAALRAAAYAMAAVIAWKHGTCDIEREAGQLRGEPYPSDYWAARAVHLVTRALFDNQGQVILYLTSRLLSGRDHLSRFDA